MDKLSFGIGRKHINPPMKMGLAGYFNTRIWENIHDPLEVRVVLLKNNAVTAFPRGAADATCFRFRNYLSRSFHYWDDYSITHFRFDVNPFSQENYERFVNSFQYWDIRLTRRPQNDTIIL